MENLHVSQQHVIQHGAPIRGRSWSSLPTLSAVESTRRLIGNGVTKVTPIDVIHVTDRNQLIHLYSRWCGRIGSLNPYLIAIESDEKEKSGDVDPSQYSPSELLQILMRDRMNVIDGTIKLIQWMPKAVISKAKFVIADILAKPNESYSWLQYVGSKFEELDPEGQARAEQDMKNWWAFMNMVYDKLALVLLEVSSNSSQTIDVEEGLRAWRDFASHFRGSYTTEEVVQKENVVFTTYQLDTLFHIGWNKRKELLNKLIERPEMNLQSILDTQRVALATAADYEVWMTSFRSLIELASVKGLKLMKSSNVDIQDAHKPLPNNFSANKPLPNNLTRPAGVPQKRPTPPTESSMKRPSPPPDSSVCYICKAKDHWANKCPNNQKGAPKASPIVPVKSEEETRVPHTQTKSGRKIFTPSRLGLNTIVAETDIPVNDTCEIESHTCLKTMIQVPCNPIDEGVDAVDEEMKRKMPTVVTLIEGIATSYSGLLDTGSNANFISSKLLDVLKGKESIRIENCQPSSVKTMNGIFLSSHRRVTLNLAIQDSRGDTSALRTTNCLVYEGSSVPGGTDFLLSFDWIIALKLHLKGSGNEIMVYLPNSGSDSIDSTTQLSLVSIGVDRVEMEEYIPKYQTIDYTDDNVCMLLDSLKADALSAGPLTHAELVTIEENVYDPALTLCFKPGQDNPPVREFGYPASRQKQDKLFAHIDQLVVRGILREVTPGSSRWLAPGYGVKKAGDRIRLVVSYTSLNDRLEKPRGLYYHTMPQFMSSIPSYATYYVVLDVKDAFHRLNVDPEYRKYLNMSVFHCEGYREYEWLKAPQGLSRSPSFWTQLIESTICSLRNFLGSSQYAYLLDLCEIVVYVDDVLIAASNEDAAKQISQIVRQTLMFNNMFIPSEKTQMGTEVNIMGFKLSGNTLSPDDRTIDKVSNLRTPRNREELNSALGLMNYLRHFNKIQMHEIDNLLQLANSKGRFVWCQEHQDSWQLFVEEFNAIPLATFSVIPGVEDVSKFSLVIQTDASLTGLGFCAFIIPRCKDLTNFSLQDQDSRLVACGSHRLTAQERLYIPHDREGYGIFFALSECKPLIYLFIPSVILQTDSKTSRSNFAEQVPQGNTIRGRRWIRWINDLADVIPYITWLHIPGRENCLADYLSRWAQYDIGFHDVGIQVDSDFTPTYSCLQTIQSDTPEEVTLEVSLHDSLIKWRDDDTSLYLKDIPLKLIYLSLINAQSELPTDLSPSRVQKIGEVSKRRFSVVNNLLLFHNNKVSVIVVPNIPLNENGGSISLRNYLIKFIHEQSPFACHRGILSTTSTLRRSFWFPGMDFAVKHWIGSCVPCIVEKRHNTAGLPNPRKLGYVNEHLVGDWAGPLKTTPGGYKYCLVLVDSFSGFLFCQPTITKTADDFVNGLLNYASLFGYPDTFSSDNDPSFTSNVVKVLKQQLRMGDETIPTYSPTTSGSAESAVKRVKQAINIFCRRNNDFDWTTILRAIVFCSNSSPRYGTPFTPFQIMLGREPTDPLMAMYGSVVVREEFTSSSHQEYVDKLITKMAEIKEYWASKLMEVHNMASDVLVSRVKNVLRIGTICTRISYISGRRHILGTVEIQDVLSNSIYLVRNLDNDNSERAHAYQLIPHLVHPERDPVIPQATPDYDSYYIVEKVLRYDRRRNRYLVHWQGYPDSEDSWVSAVNMPHDPIIRQEMAHCR